MQNKILEIKNLVVTYEDKKILDSITLVLQKNKVHALMGPNGSGKSTLAQVMMGNPLYSIKKGRILFEGKNIVKTQCTKRADMGVFLSFQNPVSIPGAPVFGYLRTIYNKKSKQNLSPVKFKDYLKEKMAMVGMEFDFYDRYLNDGFSGGERKKMEILQFLLLEPKLAIFDEIDSGLDIDSIQMISKAVNYVKEHNDITILLITHYTRILKYVVPDIVFIQKDGKIIQQGNTKLAYELEKSGYTNLIS